MSTPKTAKTLKRRSDANGWRPTISAASPLRPSRTQTRAAITGCSPPPSARRPGASCCSRNSRRRPLSRPAPPTAPGPPARRWRGLPPPAPRPPTGRVVLLSKFEETLILDGERFDLSTNLYEPGVVHPRGFAQQVNFRLDPFPVFTYQVGAAQVEKTVLMPRGENSTVVRYRVQATGAGVASLEIRPLIAFRDYHSLR